MGASLLSYEGLTLKGSSFRNCVRNVKKSQKRIIPGKLPKINLIVDRPIEINERLIPGH